MMRILPPVLLAMTLALPATGQQAQPIRIGIPQEPNSLFPRMSGMAAASELIQLLFASLITMDENWRIKPAAAENIPTQRNGQWVLDRDDKGKVVGMTLTWKLRKGCKWSDGKPVTAADYVFAHEVVTHPKVHITDRTVETRVAKLVAQDPYTLIVHWKGPFAYANCFRMSAHLALPRHLLEKPFRAAPEKLHELAYARNPVGNGPFVLDSWIRGRELTLRPNPHWFGSKPPTPSLTYRILRGAALIKALKEDQLDAISPIGAPITRIRELAKTADSRFEIQIKPGVIWEHVDLNLDNEILKDVRVRQALLYGIDRKELLKKLLGRQYPVAHSWLPSWHYGYHRKLRCYNFDPAKAASLLDSAGWVLSGEGAVRHKRGTNEQLTLEFATTESNTRRERLQKLLTAQWRKVGIEIVIRNEPARLFFGETLRKRKFKHLALYAWILGPLSDGEDLWSGSRIPTRASGWSGQNFPGLRHAQITRLHHRIPRTINGVQRIELLRKQQALWVESVPALPLYFQASASVYRKGFSGWKPTRTLVPVTWNAHEWKLVHK